MKLVVMTKGRALAEGSVRDWKGKKYQKKGGQWLPVGRKQKKKEASSFDKWIKQQGDKAARMSFERFIDEYSFSEDDEDMMDPNERRRYAEESAREYGKEDYATYRKKATKGNK